MPPPLPARYRLEVRLGRDEDIEEWLATDSDLDRPVLVRVVGADASDNRHERFLRLVRQAARVSHNHVAAVYRAEIAADSAYAITEWVGGVTLADRIEAGETPPIAEFLSNAAGLADGLAALHGEGVVHGGIDASAIFYASAHPAKLGAFGRRGAQWSTGADVQALGAALESTLTGRPAGVVPPSQVIDALPPSVDDSLRLAQQGHISAGELADMIRSIPYTAPVPQTRAWSWRWLIPTGLLAIVAAVFVWLGSFLDAGPTSPILFPATPSPSTTQVIPTTSTVTTVLVPDELIEGDPTPIAVSSVLAYDPFGDGEEQAGTLDNLVDSDVVSIWRTERYFDPLPLLKAGVGVTFELSGEPGSVELVAMSEGTTFTIYWAQRLPGTFDEWEAVASGRSIPGNAFIQLPPRTDGYWLIWMTEVPQQADGYFAELAEVRFRP